MSGMSRELTIAWTRRNCPDPRVLKDVIRRFDEAASNGFLLLIFGKHLTKSRASYLVVSHHQQMFAFELTSRQARNLEAHPDALGALSRKRPRDDAEAAKNPTVMLSHLIIDNADEQDLNAPITGHVLYQSADSHLENVAVRMTYDLPDGATVSHYDHPMGLLPASGLLRFRLTPFKNDMADQPRVLPKTLPVFIELCRPVPGATGPDVLISNACAELVDLAT